MTESPVDIALVRRLLEEQCPGLASLPLEVFPAGLANDLFRLGDGLIVRLPRTDHEAQAEGEIRWLPRIADHLTVYTPAPVFVGTPSPTFARRWTIVPFAGGDRAADVPPADRAPAAQGLADFFASLHLPAPPDLPDHPDAGVSLDQERFHERVAARLADAPDADALGDRWRAWSTVPEWDGPDLWLHGDAQPLNFLLDPARRLSGVLDWGEVTRGDPACDLASAWFTFDAAGRREFMARADAGGPYDRHIWDRARAWALYRGLSCAVDDTHAIRAIGRHALSSLLAEPAEQSS